MPKPINVTIIIPTGNRALLLRRALEQQARQSYTGPREVVIVDGGDRPFEMSPLTRDLQNSAAIGLLHDVGIFSTYLRVPPSMTIGFRRNYAIAHARFSNDRSPDRHLVIHQDDDDFYAPNYVAELVAYVEEHGPDLSGAAQFYHYDFLLRRGWRTNLWDSNEAYGASLCYFRATWERVGGFEDLQRGEDDAFCRAVRDHGLTSNALKRRPDLFVYMRHSRNVSWRIDPIINPRETEAVRAILGNDCAFYDDLAELVSPPTTLELGPQWHLPAAQRVFTGKPPGAR